MATRMKTRILERERTWVDQSIWCSKTRPFFLSFSFFPFLRRVGRYKVGYIFRDNFSSEVPREGRARRPSRIRSRSETMVESWNHIDFETIHGEAFLASGMLCELAIYSTPPDEYFINQLERFTSGWRKRERERERGREREIPGR